MRPLVAGNWKMNGLAASLSELIILKDALAKKAPACDVLICPPATLIARAHAVVQGAFALGGQDCHAEASGAFTGDVSAPMWADLGAAYVIVGHSERRQYHGETDKAVAAKAAAVIKAGLTPIVCLGESLVERDGGKTLDVVLRQLQESVPDSAASAPFVIAYEPIWAIGTGRTPTVEQVAEVHVALRNGLRKRFGAAADGVRLLYGGSVKPENARSLMHAADVDGALGASGSGQ